MNGIGLLKLYFNRFWRFALINLIYFLVTLPLPAEWYALIHRYQAAGGYTGLLAGVGILVIPAAFLPQPVLSLWRLLAAVLRGPLLLGMAEVFAETSREKHSDMSKMFSQISFRTVFFGVCDIALTAVLLYNVLGNFDNFNGAVQAVLRVSRYVSALMLAAYLTMRPYFYIMMAVTELRAFAAIKNTAICVMLRPWPAVASAAFGAVVWFVTLFTVPLATLIMLPLLTYSLCGFFYAGMVYPVIEQYVIKREEA